MFNLLFKTLRDKRFFILGWSLGLMFLGFAMTTFFTSFSGGQIDQLLSSMPKALQGLVGNVQDWRELPGYIGSQIFDIRLPIFISILSILLAVSLTVGEEDKGQLRTLIALPISRRKIVFAKWIAIVVICFAVGISTGRRSLTTGIAIILTIGSFLLTTFSQAVDWLKDYEWLSFFHYFPAVDIAKGTIEWGNTLFYVVCIFAAFFIALIAFARRDVKAS